MPSATKPRDTPRCLRWGIRTCSSQTSKSCNHSPSPFSPAQETPCELYRLLLSLARGRNCTAASLDCPVCLTVLFFIINHEAGSLVDVLRAPASFSAVRQLRGTHRMGLWDLGGRLSALQQREFTGVDPTPQGHL